ncbi:MAG: transcription elongation factor GreA [Gammaproteobacteria bacterium]|nr:transcription elongation factor GreA [Gammaproteobacteria bacterium]MCK5497926.1 transcription elongation factor GreA [Gammaproteobacteria bacterium]
MSKAPITAKGAQELREQLKEFKTVERPRISAAIAEARAHGDLSENAEYHAAREQQSFLEGRIGMIESALADAQIIDVKTLNSKDKVVFGATVDLVNVENDQEVTYQIVGEIEADIERFLISVTSPIARALISKEVDDIVEVDAPSGIIEYEILEIRYE